MDPERPDLFVPIDRWLELLRIGMTMGYPPDRCEEVAAIEAVCESSRLTVDYDFRSITVTPDGAFIPRLPETRL